MIALYTLIMSYCLSVSVSVSVSLSLSLQHFKIGFVSPNEAYRAPAFPLKNFVFGKLSKNEIQQPYNYKRYLKLKIINTNDECKNLSPRRGMVSQPPPPSLYSILFFSIFFPSCLYIYLLQLVCFWQEPIAIQKSFNSSSKPFR